jgi:small conductance mechanosensitive channel
MPASFLLADPNVPQEISRALAVQGGWQAITANLTTFAVNLALAGLILAATIWASGKAAMVARASVARLQRNKPDPTVQGLAASLARWAIVVIGLIAVLQQLGVQATSVIAVLGAASLAVGLALQGTLSNVAAGVMILILRPYRVGDDVEINGHKGIVRGLDLFSTKLVGPDGQQVFIPNGRSFGEAIVNRTALGYRRIEVGFGVGYSDDLEKGREAVLAAAAANPKILTDPPPWAHLTAMNDSSVTITLRAWVRPTDYNNTLSEVMEAAKRALETAGLSFPYPHQVAITDEPRDGREEPRSFAPTAPPQASRQ